MSGTFARLGERIADILAQAGPMPVADYMALCLGDPERGYYATAEPFGAAGDFVTAPEVSQMFGEIVGAWLIDTWRRAGAPGPFDLVELGPGRGTLMADIWRTARLAPDFRAAARVHLVETSRRLRRVQADTLAGIGFVPHWHDRLPENEAPALVVANEFFDALPVRQYELRGGNWHERRVGLEGERLRLVLQPVAGDPRRGRRPLAPVPEGTVYEVSTAAEAVMETIARRIVHCGGALLAIDYGAAAPGYGDTLQAVRGHRPADPLETPGEADLTAHVDFANLKRVAGAAGARVHGPITQAAFLLALGLLERAGRLGAGRSAGEQARITAAVERLAGERQMGDLFKVMAVTPPRLVPEPFAA